MLKHIEVSDAQNIDVSRRVAEEIQLDATRLAKKLKRKGVPDADAVAEGQAVKDYFAKIERREKALANNVKAIEDNLASMKSGSKIGYGNEAMLDSHLRHDVTARSKVTDVETYATGMFASQTAKLNDLFKHLNKNYQHGFYKYFKNNKYKEDEFAAAVFGEVKSKDFDDVIQELFRIKKFQGDWLRAKGVEVDITDDITSILPQPRDVDVLNTVSKKEFADDQITWVDKNKMLTKEGDLMTDQQLRDMLSDAEGNIYDNIVGGKINNPLGRLSPRYSKRILHYKDSKSWLANYRKYGKGSLLDNIIKDLEDTFTDMALIDKFGPSYERNFLKLLGEARKADRLAKTERGPGSVFGQTENVFNEIAGRKVGPYYKTIAKTTDFLKSLTVGARSGKFGITVLMDQPAIAAHSTLWGASYTKQLGRSIARPFQSGVSKEMQDESFVRYGIISRVAADDGARLLRRVTSSDFVGSGANKIKKMSTWLLRKTMMLHIDDFTRKNASLELADLITSHRNLALDSLPSKIRTGLESYGIDSRTWDAIRSKITKDENGAVWLDPTLMDFKDASKYTGMLNAEGRRFVPDPDAEHRAFISGAAAPGTGSHVSRSLFFEYKSFPITQASNILRQVFRHPEMDAWTTTKYLSKVGVAGTMWTAGLMQMMDLLDGRTPRDFSKPEVAMQAVFMNPVFGFNFLFPRPDEPIYTQAAQTLGPTSLMAYQLGMTLGSIPYDYFDKKPGSSGANIARTLEQTMPGSNVPIVGVALERLITDQIEATIDPKAPQRWKRQQKRLMKERGSENLWPKGQLRPPSSREIKKKISKSAKRNLKNLERLKKKLIRR